jgi:multicomponent Na+:H+ antiporter subunit F
VTGFFVGATVALALLLLFPLYRIVRGPTLFDRLVGTAMMGTKTTVLLVLMGHAVGRAEMFVDISLGYGLALLVGTFVTTRYLEAVAATHTQPARDEPSRERKDATA